jgi:hypothetical protein
VDDNGRTTGNLDILENVEQAIIKHHPTVDAVLVIHNWWITRKGHRHEE